MNQTKTKIVREHTFEIIKSAVNKMCDMIRPTFGPSSNKVIINKMTHHVVVDDGVQIARDFKLEDPAENSIVELVREVLTKTNDRVGDGTTGAAIILQSIINEVSRKTRFDGRSIELELKRGFEDFKKQITKFIKPIKTKEELKKAALVSFDNEKIAEMIANIFFKLGKDAVITIDRSPTMDTTIETTDGIKLNTGYISPYMVTNPERMETILEKPYILITDYRITETNDVLPILNKMSEQGKQDLVIIAENVEQQALATLVVNLTHIFNPQTKKPGVMRCVAVCAPKDNQKQFLEDVALMTGGKMFTASKGDKLELAEIADLGRAERFICHREDSLIISPKGKKSNVAIAISGLRMAVNNEKDEKKKKELIKRLATFTNSLAVIKVGAPTENEQKTLRYKVEDAVHAVKSAFQGGVVAGAGIALSQIKTSSHILNEALQYPSRQLRENMGISEDIEVKEGEALNVVTGKQGKFMNVGVMDPVDVLVAGVESAVSIASILLTSCGMIIEHKSKNE